MSIEEIILNHDRRGVSALRAYLPADFCHHAAAFCLADRPRRRKAAVIATGFYVSSARAPETDGPPGAIAIGRALRSLGFDIIYVTDRFTMPLLCIDAVGSDAVIDFPIAGHDPSRRFAAHILADVQPSLVIAVERCGLDCKRQYYNMMGEDITMHTAKVDYLFLGRDDTLAIGDGGNEIGMGNLAQHIPAVNSLPGSPSLTSANMLVIASVSNWGAYGLVAALSRLVKRNLLPSVEWEKEMINEMVARGAVDSASGLRRNAVDGFDLEHNAWALTELQRLLATDL